MAFNIIYGSLQELFPQVDARLLKAVAIEHSNNLESAVDSIVTDVLPYFSKLKASKDISHDTVKQDAAAKSKANVSISEMGDTDQKSNCCSLASESDMVANDQKAALSESDMISDDQKAASSTLASESDMVENDEESASASSTIGSESDMMAIDQKSASNTLVSESEQACKTDILDDTINDAKSHKKTLFAAMESVISLMREVELQEKLVEQANEAATDGGLEIFARIEELKAMLKHAKEANNMDAGEVYGEKAILATEMRELQSRLLGLSEERNKALSILDEMRETLEARFAAAETARRAAEQQKLSKEESARDALAEQERIMEKVVQESKVLQKEAEENAKLREFLMDRGQIVDTLQGEISVICLDVKSLKEKFDSRVPLSESLSSKQTSCLLASSSSSSSLSYEKTVAAPEQALEPKLDYNGSRPEEQWAEALSWAPEDDEFARVVSQAPNLNEQSLKSSYHEERVKTSEADHLDGDDWELFENSV